MPPSPFDLIRKGASDLINKGKAFLTAPDNSTAGLVRNTVTGLPKAAKDVFLPGRGYTDAEIAQAKPTVKESAIAIPKIASEIYTSVGRLGEMGANLVPGYEATVQKFVQTKTGGLIPDAFSRLERFQVPKTAGEAKAMRIGDILGFVPVAGSTKNLATASKRLAGIQDVAVVSDDLVKLGVPRSEIGSYAPLIAKETDPKRVSDLLNEAITPAPLREKGIELQIRRQSLEESPLNRADLNILKNIKEGGIRELGDIKNPALVRKVEDIMAETGIDDPTAFARAVEDFNMRKKRLSDEEKLFNTDMRRIRESDVRQASQIYEPPKNKIYRGSSGKIEERAVDFKKVKEFENDQRQVIRTLATEGNKEAQALASKYGENVPYVEADKVIRDAYKGDYDAVRFNNAQLPQKGVEYFEMGTGKFYSENPELAKIYSMQSRGAKYDDAIRPKAESSLGRTEADRLPTPLKSLSDEASELSTGEARSLEELASRQPAFPPRAPDVPNSSYDDIILRKQTDVKDKVGALDYVRTPDRVFKKIGMEDEFSVLRSADEAYKRELPKNIDKIAEWAKRVPEESNERIFKYLDGQAITLRDDELKVADEIREYLANWADRLGLPEEQRVANYITRLFEDQFIKKEFDEDLAKIIAERIPGSVYNPFLLERMGAKGYRQDTWAALDAYTKRATRKVHLDPALEGISKKAQAMEKSQYDYLKAYVDKVNMRPSDFDTSVDNTIKQVIGYRLGQRPVANMSRFLRQMAFRGMIGGNISSALRNLSQGINTYAKLGEKYTAIGYAKLAMKGTDEAKSLGILDDDFVTDRTISATKKTLERVDNGLFILFDTAEKVNRAAAFYGARAKALAEGKAADVALEYAKKTVRDTQFKYGAIDTPVALQGDFRKLLFQFLSYPVKQTEFLTEMAKNGEYMGVLRYMLGGMAFVYTVGTAVGMDPKEVVPFSGYVSGEQRFGVPPSLKLPAEIIKAVADAPDKFGRDRDLEKKIKDVGNALWGVIPGGLQIKKTLEGTRAASDGASFDKGGNLQFTIPQTPLGKAQAILFGKYSTENAKEYFDKAESKKKTTSKVRPVYDEVQKLKSEGKEAEAKAIVDSLSEEDWKTYKDIMSDDRTKATLDARKEILPTYLEVQKLKSEGKEAEAKAIVDSLSEEQWEAYKGVRKQLEKQ